MDGRTFRKKDRQKKEDYIGPGNRSAGESGPTLNPAMNEREWVDRIIRQASEARDRTIPGEIH